MRLAVFSDVHGNIAALDAVLSDIEQRDVDHLLCLGDLVAEGPFPSQVIERVRQLGCPVVQGNTDTWYKEPLPAGWKPETAVQTIVYDCYTWMKDQLSPEDHAYLLSLPFDHRIGSILAVHGSPRSSREAMLPDTPEEELLEMLGPVYCGVQVVLCGHTHRTMQRRAGGRTVLGAGSVAMSADGDWRPCYALIEHTLSGWQVEWPRVEYDVEQALKAAQHSGLPHLQKIGEAWSSGKGLTA